MRKEVMYITYKDAQRLIPFLKVAVKHGPYLEAKESANRLLQEMVLVRGDIDYTLGGRQMFLRSEDKEFLLDLMGSLEDI